MGVGSFPCNLKSAVSPRMKASQALAVAIATNGKGKRTTVKERVLGCTLDHLSAAIEVDMQAAGQESLIYQTRMELLGIPVTQANDSAARCIQQHWRRRHYRCVWRSIEARWWLFSASWNKKSSIKAAVRIQTMWRRRATAHRFLAACRIQSWWRISIAVAKVRLVKHAAIVLQRAFRRRIQHRKMFARTRSVSLVQRIWRGVLVRRKLTTELEHLRLAKVRRLFNMSRGMFQPLWSHRLGVRGANRDHAMKTGHPARSPLASAVAKPIVHDRSQLPITITSRSLARLPQTLINGPKDWSSSGVAVGTTNKYMQEAKMRQVCQFSSLIHKGDETDAVCCPRLSSPPDTDRENSGALLRCRGLEQSTLLTQVQCPSLFNSSSMSQCPPSGTLMPQPSRLVGTSVQAPDNVDGLLANLLGTGFLCSVARPSGSSDQSLSDLDMVRSQLLQALPRCQEVRGVFRVECASIAAATYSAVRSTLGPELFLWHGTSWSNVANVARNGFNRAYAYSGKHGSKLGRGSYFATDPAYALRFSSRSANSKPLFLAGVLPGKFTKGRDSIIEPPLQDECGARYDSTVDDLVSPKVFCVFRDFQALPLYLAEIT